MSIKTMAACALVAFTASVSIGFAMIDAHEKKAVEVLQQQGITVQSIGMAFLGCSADDEFKYQFVGVNKDGKTVRGYACSGYFKGTTIRYK